MATEKTSREEKKLCFFLDGSRPVSQREQDVLQRVFVGSSGVWNARQKSALFVSYRCPCDGTIAAFSLD